MPTENREYDDITQSTILSRCALALVGGGIIAVAIADATDIHLIGGGYAAIVIGAVGWGALHGHARIMEREQRHHEEAIALIAEIRADNREIVAKLAEIRQLLAENRAALTDTSSAADMLDRLERIEAAQRREIETLGVAFDDDEVAGQRRRTGH